jgi:hypothetical protein
MVQRLGRDFCVVNHVTDIVAKYEIVAKIIVCFHVHHSASMRLHEMRQLGRTRYRKEVDNALLPPSSSSTF